MSAALHNQPPTPLVEVEDLTVAFSTRNGTIQAVRDVSFTIARGETLGIVGESGSGKSVTTYALMRILDRNGEIARGRLSYNGVDLRRATSAEMQDIRGREISMIFQNPRAALNPIRKVGQQIEDVLRHHAEAAGELARQKAIELLATVRIHDPEERYHAYPHELSGGMCQRVVIALALACRPRLLIADEPTTGLDVTTQKTVLDLVAELTAERGMSTALITHDLGLAAAYCDRIVVMEKGTVIERAPAARLFSRPEHPYTRKLMRATPRPGIAIRDLLPEDAPPRPMAAAPAPAPGTPPLLEVEGLVKEYERDTRAGLRSLFRSRRHPAEAPAAFRAVDGVSFTVGAGESVGLVGESGCGKSTTSAMVMRLVDPTDGLIRFDGSDISAIPAKDFARSAHRAKLQMVFQDPTDSLNPRFTARRSIADPILRLAEPVSRAALDERVDALADKVGLPLDLLERFPHQLSGGQKARVGIARAIALNPRLLILDEPTAALDVSVQAIVLNLLVDLKVALGMSYLFVSHDLNVVRLLCDRVIVMRAGRIEETGETEALMSNPASAYTRTLIDAIPRPPH